MSSRWYFYNKKHFGNKSIARLCVFFVKKIFFYLTFCFILLTFNKQKKNIMFAIILFWTRYISNYKKYFLISMCFFLESRCFKHLVIHIILCVFVVRYVMNVLMVFHLLSIKNDVYFVYMIIIRFDFFSN
jgi:hypothetical protein